jgi:hypothetical protein
MTTAWRLALFCLALGCGESSAPPPPAAAPIEPPVAAPPPEAIATPEPAPEVVAPRPTVAPEEAGSTPDAPPPEAAAAAPDTAEADDDDDAPVMPPGYALDEDQNVVVRADLTSADQLPEGPWLEGADLAAFAGLGVPGEDDTSSVEVELAYQRRTYVLMRSAGGRDFYPTPRRTDGYALFAIWIARLESRVVDGVTEHRRLAAVRLHDLAAPYDAANDASCTIASELRPRDLDGDGEVELTVLVAGGAVSDPGDACAATAFLVGGDDLNVQARFTREYHFVHYGAGGDTTMNDDTTWVVRDANADGHGDLHVVERFTYQSDFEGDWDGEGTAPADHERASDRREVDCLYDVASDAWTCPPVDGAVLGGRVFGTLDEILHPTRRSITPW